MTVRAPRGPRAHRAIDDALPIAKARGITQLAMGGPERIYDISIVSKIPIVFASIMFAPKILASIPELAEYYKNDLARLRLIARDAAVTLELWIRSRHGTWRFFIGHAPDDRGDRPRGKMAGVRPEDSVPGRGRCNGACRDNPLSVVGSKPHALIGGQEIRARSGPGYTSFASPPVIGEAMFLKNAVILPELIMILRRELVRQYVAMLQRVLPGGSRDLQSQ